MKERKNYAAHLAARLNAVYFLMGISARWAATCHWRLAGLATMHPTLLTAPGCMHLN